MTKLVWDVGMHESGVDRGVFYPRNALAEAWNGLISVQESPSEDGAGARYLDGIRFKDHRGGGDFAGSIEAYTYPDGLHENVFGRIPKPFHFSYRIRTEDSYRIHLVYNVLLSPSDYSYTQEDAEPFSWDFTTTPVGIPGLRPSAHLIFDAKNANPGALLDFERILYGEEDVDPRLPMPTELFDIFDVHASLVVTDNGDGTFTIDGPDEAIRMVDSTTFEITWPSAVFASEDSYIIRSF